MEVTMTKHKKVIAQGKPEVIREKIESMVEERLGFHPMLQENVDDGGFEVYLHTDSYNDLEDKHLAQLELLRITDNPKEGTEAIKRLLCVEFELKK